MTDVPAAIQAAIITVLEAAPDEALRKLSVALRSTPGARMQWIRRRILIEIEDRGMRNAAFGPLTALFRARADGVRGLTFPPAVLRGLWKAVRRRQGDLMAQAEAMTVAGGEVDPHLLDRLCVSAAAVLRDEPQAVWTGLDAASAEALAACFDLAALARRGAAMLKAWTGRPDPEAEAALRLMMADVDRLGQDAAPRMLEILFANMDEAGLILRVISRMSTAGGADRLLAESEMADFGERLFERIEAAAEALDAVDVNRAEAGEAAAVNAQLECATTLMSQMELSLDLSPESEWGERFVRLKHRLGGALGDIMARCPRVIENALPLERSRGAGGVARMTPVLNARTDGPVIEQARFLLSVLGASARAASVLGCAGRRNQVCEMLEKRLSAYGDEMIEALNAGLGADERRMADLAALCADFLEAADAETPARTLRRRLASAGATAPLSSQAA